MERAESIVATAETDCPPLELREGDRMPALDDDDGVAYTSRLPGIVIERRRAAPEVEAEAQRLLAAIQAAALAAASRPLEQVTEAQRAEILTEAIRHAGGTNIVYHPGDGESPGRLDYTILVPPRLGTVTVDVKLVDHEAQ